MKGSSTKPGIWAARMVLVVSQMRLGTSHGTDLQRLEEPLKLGLRGARLTHARFSCSSRTLDVSVPSAFHERCSRRRRRALHCLTGGTHDSSMYVATRSRWMVRIAEQCGVAARPAHVQMNVVLPGEADATVDLQSRLGGRDGDVAQPCLGGRHQRPRHCRASHRAPGRRRRAGCGRSPRRPGCSPACGSRPGSCRWACRTAPARWRTACVSSSDASALPSRSAARSTVQIS